MPILDDTPDRKAQYQATGVTWDPDLVDVSRIRPAHDGVARFGVLLPELIWNAAALEGNPLTLTEVRALLADPAASARNHDEAQVLALHDAYTHLGGLLGRGEFTLTRETSNTLHALLARHEALDAGLFRGEGTVTGGGTVRLADGGYVDGRDHGRGGTTLLSAFERLTGYIRDQIDDPRLGALLYFAAATRHQFYFDGNKRTARLMMTGVLVAARYELVRVPYDRAPEFNTALDRLFRTDNATALLTFLTTCNRAM